MDTAVVWFRDDLRLTDNPTVADAVDTATTVVPVAVIDPRWQGETQYGPAKMAPHRAQFRRESLQDLRAQLRNRGGDLFIREGRAETVIPTLVDAVDADAVFTQTKPATDELESEYAVRDALPADVAFERRWTHTLYHLSDLPTPYTDINDTFTPWRKEVEQQATIREPVSAPDTVPVPDADLDPGSLPTLSTFGVSDPIEDDRAVLDFEGGETAGKQRVRTYFWDEDHVQTYKQTRNGMLGADYSTKFSPWLAAGCLSPRWIHDELSAYEDEHGASEDTYWVTFELLWRDYFQFQFIKHGQAFFQPTGIRSVEKDWQQDRTAFERWAAGDTGIPFVDANMRELNRTGYLSNRGRQNVASFLVDALTIDWRWGAAYFQSRLIDYDVASNWGNWAYQAGVGNDSRDNHFNVLTQAERYDSNAEYVQTWLPELAELPPEYAHRPWRMDTEEQASYGVELGIDYPRPMIDIEARYEELRHQ